ncbi:MAG: DUF4236 domain-containing protein [Armatimonadetes bacterium]|nr:DUF4236 domain-containing protein [Armatimonadota bacterium]
MGFRFFRRWSILPGVTLNFSKSGPSISLGPRGAKVTIGAKGVRTTVGIPGTGFYYTQQLGGSGRGSGRSRRPRQKDEPPETDDLAPSATPAERSLLQACRALSAGGAELALERAREAESIPDACFVGGLCALTAGQPREALRLLSQAMVDPAKIGQGLGRLGVDFAMNLELADGVRVRVRPDAEGVLLALAEASQQAGRLDDAIGWMERLLAAMPEDPAAKLSLAELLFQNAPDNAAVWRRLLELTERASGSTAVGCALLLYRTRALRRLGRARDAALAASEALRSPRGRPTELLRELRYERALASLELGDRERARADLRRVFDEDPYFENVAELLRSL